LATLVMLDAQIQWMLSNGGLEFAAERSALSAATLYGWAEAREWAMPFVSDPAMRSNVVGTIDLDDAIPADDVCTALRANGVLDTDSYRKLGRNQLRIAMFPAIEPADIEALTACIDHVVTKLA
jgi:phosphoserine aminotransferase